MDKRKGRYSDLPFDLRNISEPDLRRLVQQVIKAQQQNNDMVQSDIKGIVDTFNKLAGDVDFMASYLGVGGDGNGDPVEVTGGESVTSHDELEDVSANDHHNQSHTQADHDAAEAGDIAAVSTTAAAGSSTEVPNADHVHAHEAGHTAHDTVWAAKGDLIIGTANDTAAILTVGANDTILMADSAQSTGTKWVPAATPSTVSTANAEGTADTFTRGDHVHAHEAAHTAHDTVWAAKGDLVAGTANDTAAVLTVGANDTVLMADSAQATGLKWVPSQTPSSVTTANAEGTADTYARGDHAHNHGSGYAGGHTDSAAAFDDATSNPLAVSTSAADGTEGSPARKDHVHPHETAHIAHDTIWDTSGDYVRGTGADTATKQAASAATPAAVSTAGATGTSTNPPSADDHVHAHEAAHINHDTTWAAKGDLIAATANDTAAVVTVGTDDYVLTADSGASSGVSWQPAAGAMPSPFALTNDLAANVTATVSDFAPTGYATADVWLLTPDASTWTINGIAGGSDGRIIYIANVSTTAGRYITFGTAGTAGNKIVNESGANFVLWDRSVLALIYDATDACWRPMFPGPYYALPVAISSSGSAGSSSRWSMADHTHAHEATHIHHDQTWAAKGDLIAGTANDTAAIVTVGNDGDALIADSGQSTGVIWTDIQTLLADSTTTKKWFVTPSMGEVDDATLGVVGTTPDLAPDWQFAEANNRTGAYFNTGVPDDWATGTIEVFIWWVTTTSSGNVRWALSVSDLSVGDAVAETSDKLAASTTDVSDSTTMKRTSLGTFTPGAAGALLKVNLERIANNAADTATGNARVFAVEFDYTANAITAAGSAALSGLTDTNITSPATGALLVYDGTDWIDYNPNGGYFGDGSDGAIDLDGTNTYTSVFSTTGAAPNLVYRLIKEMHATTFRIRNGITLNVGPSVGPFRMLATTSFTVDSGGIVTAAGSDAVTTTGGTGQGTGMFAGGSTGGNGRSTAGVGSNGTSPGNYTPTPASSGATSGKGGVGGTAGANAGGTAGVITNVTDAGGGVTYLRNLAQAAFGRAVAATLQSGTGGGGGGVGATTASSGGGGGGGGVLWIASAYISNSGTLSANGGAGANASSTTGNAGGGGGGGGGWVVTVSRIYSGSVPTVLGGAKGNGSNAGAGDATRAGVDGSTGLLVQHTV